MNFDFSPEQTQLRNELREFLAERCPPSIVRAIFESDAPFDRSLWNGLSAMGLFGAAIPEAHGGLGLGRLELCVVAEELGRVLAPVPFLSSMTAIELLLAGGSEAQQAHWLPRLAKGDAIGTLALGEAPGVVTPATIRTRMAEGALSGTKLAVPDGMAADVVIVAAQGPCGLSLALVDLAPSTVARIPVATLDPGRKQASLLFEKTPCEPLGAPGGGWALIEDTLDRAAVLAAFEQLGGAEAALFTARDYALDRMAFGRPIGSFQAIKHMLADMYVSVTLARSNAFYAAWALSSGASELSVAAASARVSASEAYRQCAAGNIHVHGSMGFTWESDCHLHYRRATMLGLTLGALPEWEDRLVARLRARHL